MLLLSYGAQPPLSIGFKKQANTELQLHKHTHIYTCIYIYTQTHIYMYKIKIKTGRENIYNCTVYVYALQSLHTICHVAVLNKLSQTQSWIFNRMIEQGWCKHKNRQQRGSKRIYACAAQQKHGQQHAMHPHPHTQYRDRLAIAPLNATPLNNHPLKQLHRQSSPQLRRWRSAKSWEGPRKNRASHPLPAPGSVLPKLYSNLCPQMPKHLNKDTTFSQEI